MQAGNIAGRPPLSVVIAVGVRLYRNGLASVLNAQENLRVERAVATFPEARDAVATLQPDVLIVDVSLPDVCATIRAMRSEGALCRILAFAVREDIAAILDYAEAGADGFVTANGSVVELVEAIERTAAGELLCSPRIAAELLRRAARHVDHPGDPTVPVLTMRQKQVFSLLKQGLSNKEIASALGIAEATVKNHVHQVLEKLQVTSRGQAAASSGALPAPGAAPHPPMRRVR
jgi:two-component system, NarL family, nitrate/nitrite response regulator NarL